jgi:hypothetical protein
MLEAKIDQLKQSIDRLIEVLSATGTTGTPSTPAPAAAPAKAETSAAPVKADTSDAVPYEKVRDAVVSLSSTKGRDAAVAVLNGLGVKNAKELKPEQYATALDALTKAAA